MLEKVIENFGVKNQYVLQTRHGKVFQSYDLTIALIPDPSKNDNAIYLDRTYWDTSVTTLKYLKKFLGVDTKKEIEQGIKEGKYVLTFLNYMKTDGSDEK